jgi:hypothetical protein
MENQNYRPEHIFDIASSIQKQLQQSIHEIQDVHERTHVLSINARIEAARSGVHGVGFKIVADEFGNLNNEIAQISRTLGESISNETQILMELSDGMAKQVRGDRLSQISLSIMDVVDRNLYERTCDVRWWATDSSVVEALEQPGEEKENFASKRLGVILDAYTVYLDLFLVNKDGCIVANGRPEHFFVRGKTVKDESWFKEAMSSPNGQEYSFTSTHQSELLNGQEVLIYGCRVDNEETTGKAPLGALGIYFNWKSLGDAVLEKISTIDLHDDIKVLRLKTESHIIDETGKILASSEKGERGKILSNKNLNRILDSNGMGHFLTHVDDTIQITAFGDSPGFETYATGWYGIITQTIKNNS